MSLSRKLIIGAMAALALGGVSLPASAAPAPATPDQPRVVQDDECDFNHFCAYRHGGGVRKVDDRADPTRNRCYNIERGPAASVINRVPRSVIRVYANPDCDPSWGYHDVWGDPSGEPVDLERGSWSYKLIR